MKNSPLGVFVVIAQKKCSATSSIWRTLWSVVQGEAFGFFFFTSFYFGVGD
jgi:hypothetical protein